MVTYHQAFDIYHTVYRVIRFLKQTDFKEIEVDRLRIFDFFILFPHELKNMTLPVGTAYARTLFNENKYNALPDPKRIFIQLGKYFDTSINCLLSYEMIDPAEFYARKVLITKKELAEQIAMNDGMSISNEVLSLLKTHFLKMPLTELKKRTGLIEYRYDIN